MRRHSVAEFSHRVSLLNERENLELCRTMSHLTLAKKQSLQSFETEILKVKLKAKKLNLNVMDYTERKQGVNYQFEEADERRDGEDQKQRLSSRMPHRRYSISSDQRHVSFKEDEVQESDSPSIQRSLSDSGRTRSERRNSYPRLPSRSLSIDFLIQGKPVSYPKTKEMMVNNYISNNSAKSKTSRTPSPRKQPSFSFDAYLPSPVSYNDMQSPYKLLHCIGKRSVSNLDVRDSGGSTRRRKFMVTPRRSSSSASSRPKTAGSRP